MRGYQELRGLCIRLVYDRERGEFLYRIEPHPFLSRVSKSKDKSAQKAGKAKVPKSRLPAPKVSRRRSDRAQQAIPGSSVANTARAKFSWTGTGPCL